MKATKNIAFAVLTMLALSTTPAWAIDLPQDHVPQPKRTVTQHYLTPQEAYNLMKTEGASTLFVDIRTQAELMFVGYSELIDVNIPYINYDYSDWDDKINEFKRIPNSNFSLAIENALAKKGLAGKKDVRIIVMCRSGDRSARAVDLLAKLGYTNAWSQIEGFEGDKAQEGPQKGQRVVNGWKLANLPWTYKLDKAKVALLD